jgi:tryptophan synthase alpha chain
LSERPLAARFRQLRDAGRPALVPYLTAGHPDREVTRTMLERAGEVADVLELGVPFSDPLADGPVIQRATHAALARGMTLEGTLALLAESPPACPVVLFSYLNPILRYGLERFLAEAVRVGVSGLLLTDLPVGRDPLTEGAIRESPLDLVRLVAPTTSDTRLAEVARDATGFLYLIARLGVTGPSATLDPDLAASIARVRRHTSLPLAVGFGISTPEQVRQVGRLADGVVVGSALVERLDRGGADAGLAFLRELRTAVDALTEAA